MARLFLRALVLAASLSFLAVYGLAAVDALRGPRPADARPDAIEQSILEQSARFAHRDLAPAEPADPRAPVPMPGFAALVALLVGVDVPRLELGAALDFAASVLLGKLGLFTLVVVLSCALVSEPWRDREGLWIWLGVAAIVAGAVASQDARADGSALVSSIAVLALLGTLALQRVAHQLAERGGRDGHGGEAPLLAALAIQFVVLGSYAADAAWIRL